MSSFDIRGQLRQPPENVARVAPDREGLSGRSFWRNTVLVVGAHTQQLVEGGVIDANVSAAVRRALDAVYLATLDTSGSVHDAVREVEERVDAMLPGEVSGAATLGATRVETLATALRMTWRQGALDVLTEGNGLRTALLDLADVHAVTVMAGVWDRRPANPTTLAHFLGGAIGPLALAARRMRDGIDLVDRSPYGAGVLAGEVMGIDREAVARSLGFGDVITNTLDALGSAEDIVAMVEALGAHLASSRRLMSELLTWIRTEPTSFFLDERWEANPEPAMPAHTTSARLERLVFDLQAGETEIRGAVELLRSLPYGPLGAAWDGVGRTVDRVLSLSRHGMAESTRAIHEALIVNRAYLANRAGRMYSTASDFAPFLMQEEQLSPTAARQIASLVVSRLREQNLEASAVTQDIIDSAALMVIGRELKVEMETLGRYLAPRRFLERRDVLGSPAPERTRAWLADERRRLGDDREWAQEQESRWEKALSALEAEIAAGDEE
jgi:argininosuccinate lyase